MGSLNSANPAALSQPSPISLNQPQNASDWAQFANTLNQWLQYLAGTPVAYTPILTATSGSPTYVDQYGRYAKTGGSVIFTARVDISAVGSLSGPLSLSLPVASQSTTGIGTAFPVYGYGITPSGSNYALVGYLAPGGSAIQILGQGTASPVNVMASQLAASSSLLISGSYLTL